MKYKYNYLLFSLLPDILSIKKGQLFKQADLAPNSYRRWCNNRDLLLSELVKVCNRIHISISHFITTDTLLAINPKGSYTIEAGKFVPIELKTGRLSDLFGLNKSLDIPYKDVAEAMDVSVPTFMSWTEDGLRSRIKVSDFIRLCNLYHLNANTLIEDRNKPIRSAFSGMAYKPAPTVSKELEQTKLENIRLKEEVERLKNEMEELKRTLSGGYRMTAAEDGPAPYGNKDKEE